MRIQSGLLALLCVVLPAAKALDYPTTLRLYSPPKVTESVMGDVNGDGLDDIVTLHTADTSKNPYVGLVSVLLQRPSHNFDFPIVYDCGCAPEQLRLIRNPDKHGMDILYASFLSPYIGPEDTKGGFDVVDVRPDGSFTRVRRNEDELFWNYFGLVDVNQDGTDDLYLSYYQYDNTTTDQETAYRIWYGKYALQPTGPSTGKPSTRKWLAGRRNGFTLYQGEISKYLTKSDNWPAMSVDMNADGLVDLLHSYCPDQCLFTQEPYGQLRAAPIDAPYLAYPYINFGDLDGDGLPDIVDAGAGARNVDVNLQTSPGTFTQVGLLGGDWLFLPGRPLVSDMDNNGLNDVLVASVDSYTTVNSWVYLWLQTAPGEFLGQRFFAPYRYGDIVIDDVDQDGCRDVLVPGQLEYDGLYLAHGRGCESAVDLGITVSATGTVANVVVAHDRGTRPFLDKVVRVNIAPTIRDDQALALSVTPPAGCRAVPAEAPRRMFDCLLTQVDPGQRVTLPFNVGVVAGNTTDILLTAFLLDGAGDIDASNNRAQLRSHFVPGPRH